MKKLLAAALSVLMLACPFSAYAAQTEEGIAVYQEILAQSEALNDMHAYYDLTLGMSGNAIDEYGSALDMRLEMDLRMTDVNDLSRTRYLVYARMSMLGRQMDFTMYYENDWLYLEMDGQKQKTEMPLALLQSSYDTTQNYTSLLTSESYMKDLSVSYDGENRILSYRMDDSKLNQLVQALLQTSGYNTASDGITFTVNDVYGQYVVTPSGYYSQAAIHMKMDMVYEGENLTFTIDGSIGIPNPGEAVDIQAPDLSGYTAV